MCSILFRRLVCPIASRSLVVLFAQKLNSLKLIEEIYQEPRIKNRLGKITNREIDKLFRDALI